jgi:hypothetical protein
MDLNSISQLEDILDAMQTQLLSSRSTATLAMSALAEASRSLPLVAAGLEPLMTLEQDIANRLELLEQARELVRSIVDEDDVVAVQKHLGMLAHLESGCVPPIVPRVLN